MDRLIALDEVENVTSLKKSQLYAMMNAGAFPRSVHVTARRRAWRVSDVERWLDSREATSAKVGP
jgi:prophage regulatory protein